MIETSFSPFWASAPGNTIKTMAERCGLDDSGLASAFGWSTDKVTALFDGKVRIDEKLAGAISSEIGGTTNFWLAREEQYRQSLERLAALQDEAQIRNWLNSIPVRDMTKFEWIDKYTHWKDKALACFTFFGVNSVEEWEEQYRKYGDVVAFRTSGKIETNPGAVAAWMRQAELLTHHQKIATWNEKKFWESLPYVRKLTRRKDGVAILQELKETCAACGVALVVLPAPKGCAASGATKKLPGNRRLLLLSLRYKSDDQFWFTFFHEAGHLMLHDKEAFHIDGMDLYAGEDQLEIEANAFAEDIICPASLRPKLYEAANNYKSVMRFAREVDIAPGLLVGQLQHAGLISYKSMHFLKSKVISEAAQRN
ncbi:MAG: ImmA/IrrE family metallo-endopeptidase [Alphaproteobacteria bacterium]